MTAATVVIAYGLFLLVGGVIGYVKAQSFISLLMGSLGGIALLAAAVGMQKKVAYTYWVALGIALAVTLLFHYRFLITGNFMPSGFMAVIGTIATALILILRYR